MLLVYHRRGAAATRARDARASMERYFIISTNKPSDLLQPKVERVQVHFNLRIPGLKGPYTKLATEGVGVSILFRAAEGEGSDGYLLPAKYRLLTYPPRRATALPNLRADACPPGRYDQTAKESRTGSRREQDVRRRHDRRPLWLRQDKHGRPSLE